MQKIALLRTLTHNEQAAQPLTNYAELASWLSSHALNGLAATRLAKSYPEISQQLEAERYFVIAENSIFLGLLEQALQLLSDANIPAVLLKGIALLEGTYAEVSARSMNDIDLWIEPDYFDAAIACLTESSDLFFSYEKADRPLALQKLADGEIRIYSTQYEEKMSELHLSPFAGWWLKRTAAVDNMAMWQRKVPLEIDGQMTYQLAVEDSIINLAVHNVVNHQLGLHATRAFVDTAVTASVRQADWQTVAERAKRWRVATAVWLHLWFADQIVGLPDAQAAIAALRPAQWKVNLFERLVSAEKLINGQDMRNGRERFLLLLLMIDRPQDAAKLLYRSVWPEPVWLSARYGEQPNLRLRHFKQMFSREKL